MATSTTPARKGFGKRGGARQAAGAAQPRAGRRQGQSSSREGHAVEFRYTPSLSYAGLLILVPIIDGTIGFGTDWSMAAPMGGPPAAWEQFLFSLTPYIVGALGLFWFVMGLRGGTALRVAPEGVSASTFYGRVSHDWDTVGRISVFQKPSNLRMKILSAFGADTGSMSTTLTVYPAVTMASWFKTPIEVRVCNADGSLEEMLEAIALYRPELLERVSG